MSNLSPAGQQLVQTLSQRHGVSPDAVTHMLIAVHNGNGTMAQFRHQEFGGGGQWMSGGMTMVSDLFNHQLKSRVDNLCSDISREINNHQNSPLVGSFQSQSQSGSNHQTQAAGNIGEANSLFAPDPEQNWWPQELGSPSALGSQNNTHYAYFANARRLAVKTGGDVWVYDTGDHQIGGFSQQQGMGGSITFSSQFGTVNLSTLPVVTRNGNPIEPSQNSIKESMANDTQSASFANSTREQPSNEHGILATLEKLGGLRDQGYLSDEEFNAKKAELLSRL